MTHRQPNLLLKEKSPYLLQHAYNPIQWYPWGEAAFQKAKQENKPVFVSIGYSTCHWCHVMEKESFEDEEVAAILNENFISIKVDREERPDVDHLYMAVCQALTGQGGWPLTVILTPQQQPFFAGTYFPKQRKYNRNGLLEILPQIIHKWNEEPQRVINSAEQITEQISSRHLGQKQSKEDTINSAILHEAFKRYAEYFEPTYGGFGSAPKFPTSHNLSYLLRYYHKTKNEKALHMVETTLDAMYRGGMYDHIGFGFARYATDEKWLVPHFEKMLYDNALLAITYLEAYQITGKQQYATIAEQIFTYVLRDMTDEQGGFYCAEDADSEGEEGKFYVWTPEEIKQVIGEQDGAWFCQLYDITEEGNFEGKSIPNLLHHTWSEFASAEGTTVENIQQRAEQMREALFHAREARIHPHKDDKMLTSWNALMITALAKGAQVLGHSQYITAAEKAVKFIQQHLMDEEGRLLARYRDGEAAFKGYVDDYAFLIWSLTTLYEVTFNPQYMELAIQLQEKQNELFWDEQQGGYYFYGNDSEQLLLRLKEIYDGAMPSGNGISTYNLARLAKWTMREDWNDMVEQQLLSFQEAVSKYPMGYALYVTGLDFYLHGNEQLVIAGDIKGTDMSKVQAAYKPNTIMAHAPNEEREQWEKLIPIVADKQSIHEMTTYYVCEDFSCQAPTTSLEYVLTKHHKETT
ncbi:thioredoxin domain-containing protein [Longirhabdus pacifica]|uniref:thioredoxin domain-containing protein n=1 Tax=Longirhabdus pacifica TaxID=2305227 RepID=UPI001008A466|nr:thioredoxin domain-containing protein [Longirhabdus pacifica]